MSMGAMRRRLGAVVPVALFLAVSACSSSRGGQDSNSGSLEARPLIMPARHATGASSVPFGSLHLPKDEDAYSNLSTARQAGLANALRGVNCSHPPVLAKTADRVVCDAESYAYLLGAPIFTADDVTDATAIPPPAASNTEPWQIELTLTSAGADKEYQWTSQHHVASLHGVYYPVQTTSRPPCGVATTTPCSDYTAYIVDDVAVTATVTALPFRSRVLFAGDFNTNASTNRLTHKIAP